MYIQTKRSETEHWHYFLNGYLSYGGYLGWIVQVHDLAEVRIETLAFTIFYV